MKPPALPFQGYKWRWASNEPSENLNAPSILLGVLRAVSGVEGALKSSQEVREALRKVQPEADRISGGRLNLVRSDLARNLFRNSGQYWTHLGLMEDVSGVVRLTPLGRALANGTISRKEFAAHVVATYRLPNPGNAADVRLWNSVGLEIFPFRLILEVVKSLRLHSASLSFITKEELIRIVIPAAGQRWETQEISKAVRHYRNGRLDLSGWPSVTPGANDHRFAKEYLLFLAHFGYLSQEGDKFILLDEIMDGVDDILQLLDMDSTIEESIDALYSIGDSLFTDQARSTRSAVSKERDPRFRKNVIDVCNNECVISTVSVLDVLEAAHIIPVEYDGSDDPSNGLLLRRDYHRLFDKGLLRIHPDGQVQVAQRLSSSGYYSTHIPGQISIPSGVALDALRWRLQHL